MEHNEPLSIHEIEVGRLVLRDPDTGVERAVLETADPYVREEGVEDRVVRLQLFTIAGEAGITVEIDETGEPRVYVGQREIGRTIAIGRKGIDAWQDGSATQNPPEE